MANSTLDEQKDKAMKEQLDALNQKQRRTMEVERSLKLKSITTLTGNSQQPQSQQQTEQQQQEVSELNRMYSMPSPPEEQRSEPENRPGEEESEPDSEDQEDEPNEEGDDESQQEPGSEEQPDKPEEDDQDKLNNLRRIRDLEKASRAGEAAAGAGSTAGTAATAAEGVEAAAATTGVVASTAWFWGPALAVLAILGLIMGLFMFVAVTAVAYCNSDSWAVQGAIWVTGNSDFCKELQISQAPSSGGAGGGTSFEPLPPPTPPTGGDPTGVGCQDCVTLASVGLPTRSTNVCSGSEPCQIESVTAQKLVALNSSLSGWVITEAWPPTVTHQNPCHNAATCVDANFTNPSQATAANISNFIAQANAAGLRAVYEVQTQAQKDQLVANGVPASNVQVVTAITATHFSVYNL